MDELAAGIVIATDGWDIDDLKPETGEPYDDSWWCLFLCDKNDDQFWNGSSKSGLFSVKFNMGVPDLRQRIADMVSYTQGRGKSLIIGTDRDFDLRHYIEQIPSAAPTPAGMRITDSRYLVHSTSRESWLEIQKDMLLKSPTRMSAEGVQCVPIGKLLLGDPADFATHKFEEHLKLL